MLWHFVLGGCYYTKRGCNPSIVSELTRALSIATDLEDFKNNFASIIQDIENEISSNRAGIPTQVPRPDTSEIEDDNITTTPTSINQSIIVFIKKFSYNIYTIFRVLHSIVSSSQALLDTLSYHCT